MNHTFTLLRTVHREFIYHGFTISPVADGVKVVYNFEIPELCEFHPTWMFPFERADAEDETLNALLFDLGMVELVSYWKCCCPELVKVECGRLDARRTAFYKKLYFNGLGEFFYRNDIKTDIDSFMTIESSGADRTVKKVETDGMLIPVGGGKDSVVTMELTKKLDMKRVAYMINPTTAGKATARAAGFFDGMIASPHRTIDQNLLDLNARGFLNGHTPFSAIVAFSALVTAYLKRLRYIVLSNESSANETTVGNVNHQYSKSIEFERDFCDYVKEYLDFGAEYFSLLRPFSEIRIARDFARYPIYFDKFLSCNKGSKTGRWCHSCPKCLFVYLMLAPYVDRKTLNEIFGADIANDESMLADFRKVLGTDPEKPFECVGSRSEASLACALALKKYKDENESIPFLLREYENLRLPSPDESILSAFDCENFVPDEFIPCLDDSPVTPLEALAEEFAGKKVAILGFGREGLSTYRFYRRFYKDDDLVITDKKIVSLPEDDDHLTAVSGAGYLIACRDVDIVMISPGIPQFDLPEWILPKLQSQTRLFLRHFGNRTVGVTGTKGKSTCSSLIAATLDNALLVGNIGKPVFDYVLDLADDTTVVYELSCHQLENCESSPKTAVLTNLYEEHLDHYGSFERYFAAKKNIFTHQRGGELVYDHKNARVSADELPENALTYSVKSESGDISVIDGTDAATLKTPLGSVEIDKARLNIKGLHNLGYAAIAYYLCKKQGVADGDFLQRLYDFKGLPHRLEFVAEKGGVAYYDDSISTIPQAAIAGIESLKNVGSIILGGLDRRTELTPIADYLSEHPLDAVILIPQTGEKLKAMLRERNVANVYFAEDVPQAVKLAALHTPGGKSCLFSPAAASYHAYKNFEERGEHFKKEVMSL